MQLGHVECSKVQHNACIKYLTAKKSLGSMGQIFKSHVLSHMFRKYMATDQCYGCDTKQNCCELM